MSETTELWNYRRRVSDIYAAVRTGAPTRETWMWWRDQRDHLFATHPQSPLDHRESFTGLLYFDYDPKMRVEAAWESSDVTHSDLAHSSSGSTGYRRVGTLRFDIGDDTFSLGAFWLDAYGGGMFVPFRDSTNGSSTYGGGRYLIDSAKGADLGASTDSVTLDFNYAYHPSCVYSARWSCPLAPPENRLDISIRTGERLKAGLQRPINARPVGP